jgi:L-lactate dehydrogenase complex protein LldG
MEESSSREKILKKIRNALISRAAQPVKDLDFSSSIYNDFEDSLDVVFAQELTKVSGNFIFCESIEKFTKNLKSLIDDKGWKHIYCPDKKIQVLLKQARIPYKFSETAFTKAAVGLTGCEYLVARFGCVVVSSKGQVGRKVYAFPETHLVLAFTSQIVPEIRDALSNLKKKYSNQMPSMVSFITGPSRTADIEKTLVMGAHGPKELYVFLVDA